MRRWVLGLMTAGLAAVAAMPAQAEKLSNANDLDRDTPLGQYLYAKPAMQRLYDAAAGSDQAFGIACKESYSIQTVGLAVLKPITLTKGAAHPKAGVWEHQFNAIRCGASKRYNVVMIAKGADVEPQGGILLPGTTLADPKLTSDVMPLVFARAATALGDACKDSLIFDTQVNTPPKPRPGDTRAVWQETWTVIGCGKTAAVPIDFIPDSGNGPGTSFVVNLAVAAKP